MLYSIVRFKIFITILHLIEVIYAKDTYSNPCKLKLYACLFHMIVFIKLFPFRSKYSNYSLLAVSVPANLVLIFYQSKFKALK